MVRTLLVMSLMFAGSALAAPVQVVELVSFDNRPEGSEWMGTFHPADTEEKQDFEVRKWADQARQHLQGDSRPAVLKRTSESETRLLVKPRRATPGA